MPTTQELREQRAQLWEQMQEVVNRADRENRSLNEEDKTVYDRLEADLDKKGEEIARAEKHLTVANAMASFKDEQFTASVAEGGDANSDKAKVYAQAFDSWMRGGVESLDAQAASALRGGFTDLKNAAGVGTGAAGGYTVPAAFRAKIVEQITFSALMRQLAEVVATETGAPLSWPTVDDTANEGVIVGENTQVTEQDVVWGSANLDAYMYSSKIVRVSFQLLQDNAFQLEDWLAKALGSRIGRIQNRHFTVGTGTGQPDGIVTSAGVGKQGSTGQTTSVTYDDLVDLTDSLDPAYLAGGNCGWMMSQTARKGLRKLKDGSQRPLWEPSLQAGVPDSVLGFGLTLNNYMPVPAASAKSILFGDFKQAYVIRDISDVSLLRMTERYADFFQVGFVAFQRSDGTMQNASAVKAYQNSAT